MKRALYLVPYVLSISTLYALPESATVSHGQVEFHAEGSECLKITASDKAIINYRRFDVGAGERVEFIQPSAQATVLNRIKGGDESRILGSINANGRVFLVNPNGIYFGPHATVNAGSFLASTLNIRDEDFLNDTLQFFREQGTEKARIVNEGSIAASPEGFIAFFAPFIENRGSILARAGKVVLAAAERVALDFTGDGLIQFIVDGDLKQALIENYGSIEAAQGSVEISLRTARDAIKMVVNTDGIALADGIEEANGIIRLVSTSALAAKQVRVDGATVDVHGAIDASSAEGKGGEIHLLGENVQLIGARIDASGPSGGGTVLIGGDFQGKGALPTAQYAMVDSGSEIKADATQCGDGGKVILWADETALFDGMIFARGGVHGGDGGFVETSGKENLIVNTGNVNTLSPNGKTGSWLMDPSSITIARNNTNQGAAGLNTAATCTGGGFNLNDTTINNAASTVVLCTAGTVTQNNNAVVNITTAGVGITFGAASTPSNITFQTGGVNTWSITTNNGPLTFNGPVTIPAADTMSLNTSGGNVTFASTINGAGPLVVNAGAGTTTFTGAVGGTTALTSVTATSATITQTSTVKTTGAVSYTGATAINVNGNITTSGGTIGMSGPVVITGTPTFDSTNAGGTAAGATISFSSTLDGAAALALRAGTAGNVSFAGAVGGINPLTNLSFTSANLIQIGNNITVTGANPLTFPSPVSLTGTSTITSNNANVSFNSTVNGGQALTVAGGSGTTTFTGAVGATTPLSSLSATAATITQSSTAKTTGAVSYTGSTAINVNGNITTSGGTIGMTGPVAITGAPTFDSTNAGGTPAGAAISFSSTLNGATALTLAAGTAGNVSFGGAVGGVNPLTNLTFTSANLIQIGNNITVTGANPLTFPFPASVTGASIITSNNANINFNSTINGAQALTLAGGSGTATFAAAVGGTTPLASLSAAAATITQSSTVKTTGAVTYSGSSAININGNITTSSGAIGMTGPVVISATSLDTTNGGASPLGANISFSSTVNGATALTLNGGSAGAVSFSGAVGGITPLTSLTVTGLTITQGSTVHATGAVSYTGSTAINVNGNVTTNGATIGITGPLVIAGNPTFDTTNAGAIPAGATISFSNIVNGNTALTLRAGTAGNVSFAGAIGGITPLTNLSFTSANTILLGSDITVTGANPLNFPFPVTLSGISNITSNNAGVGFASTINGDGVLPRTLRLIAGSGSITLTGAVGGTIPLGTLAITSANNVTANAINAGTISQGAGTGTTTFNGAIATSDILGIALTGNAFTFNNTVATTTGGGVSISNGGLLTMPFGSTFTLDGPFSQTGAGAVQCGNTITSNNGILFSSAVALTHAASFSTAAAAQLITFSSTIDSVSTTPFNLTLDAGTSSISILGNMGSIHPLAAFLINTTNNVTIQGLVADSVTLNGGTGTTTVNGNLTIGSGGVNVVGNNFANNGNLTTTGSVSITNTGSASRAPGRTTNVGGNFTIHGPGPTFGGGHLTVGGNALFVPAVTLVGNTILDTSSGNGNITFSSTINGSHDLTLIAGSGTILISGAVGSGIPIGAFTVSSATNVTTQGIIATSIAQTAGTGTTQFNGALSTSGASGISINTNVITRGAAITTTGGGPLTITNSGLFTSTAAGAINLGGAFTQNGAGAVSFGGSITTANANIAFASPVALAADMSLNSGSSVGDITLSQTVQGGFALNMNTGTGTITLGGNVGTVPTPLTGVTITRAGNVSTQGIVSTALTQSAGTGTTTFNGALTIGATGISLTGSGFTFNNTFTTTGPAVFTNSGALTFSSSATGSVTGALTQTGTGSTQLSSTITAGGAMQFGSPFTVSGTGSLTTQAANQPITFFSTVNGPGNLTLSSGTADILISGNAGSLSSLGNLTISTARNVTAQAITASSITQSAGTGTTLFNGALATSGSGGINLTGAAFTFVQNATASGSGAIAIANAGTLTAASGRTLSGNGGFAQTGAGAVSLGSNVSANSATISFASPITLTSDVVLNSISSGSGGGRITCGGAVTGNFNLTLTAGTNAVNSIITLSGDLGTALNPLNNVTFTSSYDASTASIYAQTFTQLSGAHTLTIGTTVPLAPQTVEIFGPGGIHITGTNISRVGATTTHNGGDLVLTNAGSLTGAVGNVTTVDGAFIQNGSITQPLNAAGTITAKTGISYVGPLNVLGSAIFDTSGGNGNIVIGNTVNGPQSLTLRAGSGNVTFSSSVGNSTPLSSLIFGNVNNITAPAIAAGSIQQEALTTISGQATFNGAITTSASPAMTLSGNAFAFNSSVTTAGGGTVALTNSGLLTIGNVFTLDGSFTQSGAGTVSLGGSITTTNDAIAFASPITLTAPSALNSGAGAGNITLSGSVDGATTLSLTAGTGNVDIQGVIGHTLPLTGLTIPSANTVLVNAAATLSGPFTITSASGASTFNGSLQATAVSLTGTAVNFNQAVTATSGAIAVTNSGTLTVASTAPITAATSFTQTGAGAVSLGANIGTTGALSIASPVTLTNNIALNSGGGHLTLSNTVGGVFDLNLTAGSGDITISGNIGAPRIGAFTITSARDISVQAITASSMLLQNATGTSTLLGNLDTNTVLGITLIGNAFTSSGTVTTTNGGPFTLTNSGLVTGTGASTITLNGGGSFIQNGTGPVNVGGSITTQNGDITHSSPVSVLLPTVFTSNGGDITFQNTVNGPACLTTAAGTGDVIFNGAVGGTTALGCLTASGVNIFQTGSLRSTGVVQETGTGSINLGGNITTTSSAITLTGNTTTKTSLTMSTSGGAGNISITGTVNGDLAGYDLSLQTGTGDITLASAVGGNTPFRNLTFGGKNISWANLGSTSGIGASGTTSLSATTNINFTGTSYINGTQVYTAGTDFNFTAGAPTSILSNNLPITFNTGTIQLGATDLSIDSNGGSITLRPLLGTGRNLNVDADVGALTFVQIGAMGDDLNNVTLTSNAYSPTPIQGTNVFSTSLTVNSSTPQTISTDQTTGTVTYNSPVIIQGNIHYTCGAAGTITFNKRVDANTAGVDTLSFDFAACTPGNIVFNGPIGSVAPLASLSINVPQDVTMNSTVALGSLAITAGTGTTAVNSGITSTAAGGVSIATPIINLAGAMTTASGGPVVLDNSGALTIAAGSSFDISGTFTQSGAGSVSIGGALTTHDQNIQFTGPVTLNSTTIIDSSILSGAGISFASTIQGAQNLTLEAGSGSISFMGAVGSITPLLSVQINSAADVTAAAALSASTLTQLAGTGQSSFDTLTTTGLNGIRLTGYAFTFNNNVTASNGGPVILNNGGLLTFKNAAYGIAGALTQSGAGATTAAGTFTVGGPVSFANPVTLSDTTSFNTSATGQSITFASTILNDLLGPHDLTLNAGTGSITCVGAIGATPIGALTISNAGNASFGAISATSILQSAGTGSTTIAGNLTTSGVSGISLTGTNFSINGTATTSALGPFSISNTGPLSLTLGSGTSIAGAFAQSGGGAVSLSGTVATVNQPLSFANAITLAGASVLSTGSGAGTITLSSTVDGNRAFSLTAGTGNIVFGANLGSTTPLGALTVNSVTNVTYPLINAASIVQLGSSGTTTITGPFNTTGALGISISGGAINQNGAITAINTGPVSFINTGTLTVGVGVNTIASGNYSQSGGGAFNLGGSITSTSNSISIGSAVALTADVAFVSGTGSKTISFSNPITGAHALSLTSANGTITFSGDVGTLGTPLTAFTIANAQTVSTQGVYAQSITQSLGTGTTTFNGPLNATSTDLLLTGTAFIFNNTVTTNRHFTLTNSGLATFNSGSTGAITGALTQNGTGAVRLSSSITAGGAVSFTGAFSVPTAATGTLSTQAANQPITFSNTVDGPGNLTLSSGTNAITFQTNAGFGSRLGALTITTAGNFTAQSIKAASILQSAGTGLSLFNGDVDTTGASGINLSGTQMTFSGNLTTTGGGAIALNNSGTLTTSSGKTFASSGVFTQNGSGSVLLASTIRTTSNSAVNAAINFSGTSPITLTAPAVIDSSTGGGTINFSLSSTVDGHQPLTISAGTGDVNILGAFGGTTRLGAMTITSAKDVQVQAITANSIAQNGGSGTSSLLGSLDTDSPAGITLVGNNFATGPLAASITTANGGSLTFMNQGTVSGTNPVVVTVDGAFIQNGPGPIFLSSATARQGFSFSGPVILPATATINSSGGNGDMTFSNIVCGLTGAEGFTLNAGTGDIVFSQPIGLTTTVGVTPVTALGALVASAETITINDIGTVLNVGVNGATGLTTTDTVIFTGTNYYGHTQNYTGAAVFQMNGGGLTTFSSAGSPLTFSGPGIKLGTGTDLSLLTGGPSLALGTIHALAGNHRTLNLDAGAGNITIGNLGAQGNGEFASATFTGANLTLADAFADLFTFIYTGTLNAGGKIFSTDSRLTFSNPVVLQASSAFSTVGTTGRDISFLSTLDGNIADAYGLTLTAGAGNITFTGNVGVSKRLLNLAIASASNVTLVSPSSMRVDALVQSSGTGTTTFNGPLVVPGVLGIALTGNAFAFNSSVTTLNNASLTVSNSGTLNFAGTAALSGAFTQNISSGPVTLSGSITAGQPISFSGPVTLSGTPSLNTAAANQGITFLNTIGGTGNLTLNSGSGGDITLGGAIGTSLSHIGAITVTNCHNITAQSVFANSLQLSASSGIARVNGTLSTNGAAGVNLVGTNFILNGALNVSGGGSVVVTNSGLITGFATSSRVIDGSYTQNGTGPVNFAGSMITHNGTISFASPVTFLGPSSFDSSGGNKDVTFSNTIDGPSSASITAGGGNVTFAQVAGGNIALSNLSVISAYDVSINGVGTTASGVLGTLSLNATHDINFPSNSYTAAAQTYSAGHGNNFNAGIETHLHSEGPIAFASGPINLSSGNDLHVETHDGDFSFESIRGTNLERIVVSAGTGTAALNTISTAGTITALIVDAGRITLSGPIDPDLVSLTSLTSISNTGGPVLIQSPNTVFFNALGGDVGTLSSPIFVQSGGQIFAGAFGEFSLADFNGTSVDNTVNPIPSNPPCEIIFNGVVVKSCTIPPTPPTPVIPTVVSFPFAVPGFDSSYFNLASDYFFFSDFIDDQSIYRETAMYYRAPAAAGH